LIFVFDPSTVAFLGRPRQSWINPKATMRAVGEDYSKEAKMAKRNLGPKHSDSSRRYFGLLGWFEEVTVLLGSWVLAEDDLVRCLFARPER
jgi:hypothetical protein